MATRTRLAVALLVWTGVSGGGHASSASADESQKQAVMYLPLNANGSPGCVPSAEAKLAQLMPLLFAGMTFTVFDAVATVANNLNTNNNNNNNQNLNFQQSVNTVVTGNINVANQINVMMGIGRRKRRRRAVLHKMTQHCQKYYVTSTL